MSVYVDFNLLVYKIISNESFEIQNHLNFAFNIRHTLFLPIPIYKRLHLIYDDRVFVIGHFKWDDIQTRPNQLELELRLQHFYEWTKVSYHFVGFFLSLSQMNNIDIIILFIEKPNEFEAQKKASYILINISVMSKQWPKLMICFAFDSNHFDYIQFDTHSEPQGIA